MCQPYIESITVLSDEEPQNFRFLSGCTYGLPALSWPQKRKCRLEILCSVLVSVCIWHTCLSWEKCQLEFYISWWNRMCQPYIESVPALDDYSNFPPKKKD